MVFEFRNVEAELTVTSRRSRLVSMRIAEAGAAW